jgi:hypothetical protein
MGRRPEGRAKRLVESGEAKVAAGQKPNRAEQAALDRVSRESDRTLLLSLVRSVPKSVYIELSGRQSRTLNEQAVAYGIPIAGETIDVGAVLSRFHDILRDNHREIRKAKSADFGDPLLDGVSEDGDGDLWLARYREKKTRLAELELQQKEGSLVPRSDIREVMDRAALMIRQLQEDLERKFGPDAADLAGSALDGLEREIGSYFGGRDAA